MNYSAIFSQMNDWLKLYYYDSGHWLLAAMSYLYLFASSKGIRRKLIWPTVLLVFLLMNPILYAKLYEGTRYWRWFWMIASAPVIAAAFMRLVKTSPKNAEKLVVFCSILVLIVKTGSFAYDDGSYYGTENLYKIEPETALVGEIILSVEPSPNCICPAPLCYRIRQYSGDIEQLYGRDAAWYIVEPTKQQRDMFATMLSKEPDYDWILKEAQDASCNIIVTRKENAIPITDLTSYGFELAGESTVYYIYHSVSN